MSSTEQQAPATGFSLILTDKAVAEVKKFIEAEQVPVETAGLRVGVLPGEGPPSRPAPARPR